MKSIMIMAVSMDGYITKHQDGLVDWSSKEDKQFFSKMTKDIGVLVYGKKTYDTFNKPLPGRLNIVMTRTPDTSKNIKDELEFTNQSPKEIFEDIKRRGFDRVAITGGAEINTLFLKQGLIDEIYLSIEPHIFGSGKQLFADFRADVQLNLLESKVMKNKQTVLLHYQVLT